MKNYLKKIMLIMVGALVILSLMSCGSLFPNTATIKVKNDSYVFFSPMGDREDTIELKNAFIEGAGIKTDKKDSIENGKDYTFELSWFGGRNDFVLRTDSIRTNRYLGIAPYTASPTIYTYEYKDVVMARVSDVGNGDSVVVTIKSVAPPSGSFAEFSVPKAEVSKE